MIEWADSLKTNHKHNNLYYNLTAWFYSHFGIVTLNINCQIIFFAHECWNLCSKFTLKINLLILQFSIYYRPCKVCSAHTFCAGLHSNGLDPTVGILLIFRIFWTFLNWISSLYSFSSIANQKSVKNSV